jgi:predicted MPP superfamily phosphohydrolase
MSILAFVLWAGVLGGNTALLVFSLNWWYGNPLNHKLLDKIRYLHGLLVVAIPAGVWLHFRWDLTGVLFLDSAVSGPAVVVGYLFFCWLLCFGVVPVITARRLLHRPQVVTRLQTRTVNVAALLGYKPIGRGLYPYFARLPGNNIFRVDFTERTLCLPNLPLAWDGLSILHLTDVHFHGTPDRTFHEHVMDICRDWEPDLLALTGDVVDSDKHHRWILPILGRLRWRLAAFAILGNHDRWFDPNLVRRRLRRLGMHVLLNNWQQFDIRGEPLIVVGHEGPWQHPDPDLKQCPEGVFRLCLSHTPDNIGWARRNQINLMLSGHNHGGQIRFPLIGSVLVPSRYSRRYDCGTFEEGPTVLHVCRGLAGKHPLRYNCRPEVTKIILQARKSTSVIPA